MIFLLNKKEIMTVFVINVYLEIETEITGFDLRCDIHDEENHLKYYKITLEN